MNTSQCKDSSCRQRKKLLHEQRVNFLLVPLLHTRCKCQLGVCLRTHKVVAELYCIWGEAEVKATCTCTATATAAAAAVG